MHRTRTLHRFAIAAFAALAGSALAGSALAAPARAQDPSHGPRHSAQDESPLERWRHMSPEARETMKRRFDEWQRMDEGERNELRERAQRMREMEARVLDRLPEAERRRWESMSPDERRNALRERFERAMLERGGELRSKLPPELRDRLESASQEERCRLLRSFKLEHRRAEVERAIEFLGRKLELPEDELHALRALPPEAQWAKVLELRRREISEHVEREGLPDGVAPEEWQRWRELPDREFFEHWHGCQRGHEGEHEGGEHRRPFHRPRDRDREHGEGELR